MSAQRKPRQPIYYTKSNGDRGKYDDRVTLAKVKPEAVGSEDRHNPLMSVVQVQMGSSRTPRDLLNNPPNVIDITELNPGIKPIPLGKKWCSACGDWVDKKGFSPKADNRDGLHTYCKECRNEQKRKHYWLEKAERAKAA